MAVNRINIKGFEVIGNFQKWSKTTVISQFTVYHPYYFNTRGDGIIMVIGSRNDSS